MAYYRVSKEKYRQHTLNLHHKSTLFDSVFIEIEKLLIVHLNVNTFCLVNILCPCCFFRVLSHARGNNDLRVCILWAVKYFMIFFLGFVEYNILLLPKKHDFCINTITAFIKSVLLFNVRAL